MINYSFHLAIYLSVYIIMAMSLNVLVGYSGLLTLAHASYFAVGAYCYALAALSGWGFMASVILAAGVAGAMSLASSLPSWRLKGDFFVMVSMAVQALFFGAIHNWVNPGAPVGTWANLTNGPFGIAGVPRPIVFGIKFDTLGETALVAALAATVCLALGAMLLRSPWGRALKTMRDDELAARGLGKNVRLLKVQAFVIASAMVAVGGAIYASYVSYVDSSLASMDQSILMLSMVIVGGVGNFRGPLVGAVVLLAIPEALRFANIPDAVAANIRLMVYGVLLVLMMHFRPQGLAGSYRLE